MIGSTGRQLRCEMSGGPRDLYHAAVTGPLSPLHRHPLAPGDPSAGPAAADGWRSDELTDPHRRQDKPTKVRGMFAAIAKSYDLNNRVHSLWRDQAWRRYAVRRAGLRGGEVVLDVACGTGDLTQAFAAAKPAPASVIGLDFTPEMLDIAREKLVRDRAKPRSRGAPPAVPTTYMEGDATALPLGDASVDVVSIAFGIRNVGDPAKAAREFFRVLRPGGRLIVLEFDQPRFAPLRWMSKLYTAKVMPRTATWISGDRSGAYKYLPASVETFMDRDQLSAMLMQSGFAAADHRALSLGICVCHRATKG